MKAKVIKTGEVVEVHKTTTGWASENLNKTRFFEESELDFDYREWVDFRKEAAKEILANMLSCPTTMNLGEKAIKTVGDYVSFAIGLADELIKQLKEER